MAGQDSLNLLPILSNVSYDNTTCCNKQTPKFQWFSIITICSLLHSNLMQVLLVSGERCFRLMKLQCHPGHQHVKSIWEKGVGERDTCFLTTLLQEMTHITCHISLVSTSHLVPPGCKGEAGTYNVCLDSCFPGTAMYQFSCKCALWTCNIRFTGEFVRNAHSWALPRITKLERMEVGPRAFE